MHHHLLLPQRSSQRRPPQGRFSMQLHILPCLFWVMMISSWLSKGVVHGNSLPLLLSNRGGSGGSNNNNDSVDKGSSNKGSTPFGVVGKTAQSARNIIRRRRLQQGRNVNHKDDKDEKEKSTITVAEKEGQDDTATSKGSNNNHNDHQDANSDNTQLTTSNTSSNSIPQQPSIRLKPRIVSLNVMIAGLSGLGKTTACASLLDAWQQLQPKQQQQQQQPQERYTSKVQSSNRSRSTSSISPKTLHVDPSRQYKRFDAQENTWVHVRIIDTPGFGNRIDHRDAVRPILKYIHKCRRQHYRYFTAANRGGEFLYTYLLLDVVPVVDGGGKADYIRSGDAEPQTLVELSFDVMSNAISNAQFKEIKWAATLSLSLLHMQNRKAAQQ